MARHVTNVVRRYRGRVAACRTRRPPRKGERERIFDTLKKIAKNPLVKEFRKKALTYAPKLYKYGTSKVKNKRARKILN